MCYTIETGIQFTLERQTVLKKTFETYVDTEFEGDACKQKTSFYQRVFTENVSELKSQLIETYKNETGKTPECNS